jgi:transmembrane sensor
MTDQPDWRTLDRYLARDASPDEERAVREWIAADPARAEVLRQLQTAHRVPDAERWDVDAAWAKLASRVGARASFPAPRVSHPAPRAWYTTTPMRVAAALLLTVAAYGTWQIIGPTANRQIAMHEISTPNGRRETVTLGDGSRVVLNAGSRLRYAADVARGSRDVYLDGEAYFNVTHDAARPFRVHARGGVAHDLGTRFTVRAYAELSRVEVVVAEGRVSLRRDDPAATDSVVLAAGQLGRLAATGSPTVVSRVDTAAFLGWTGGSLVLEGLTLEEALPQLERWFDVELRVADRALASRRLFARFRDETLTQVLDALSLALGARYERSGRVVTLHSVAPTSR